MSAAEEYRAAKAKYWFSHDGEDFDDWLHVRNAERRLDDAVRALIALGIQRAIGREGGPMTWEPTLAAELLPKE